MKKIFAVMMLLSLAACSSCGGGCGDGCCNDVEDQYDTRYNRVHRNYEVRNYQNYDRRVYDTCGGGGGCQDQVRTVREPVEILYKRTTYRTVYQPRTYTTTKYERAPYSGQTCEGCR